MTIATDVTNVLNLLAETNATSISDWVYSLLPWLKPFDKLIWCVIYIFGGIIARKVLLWVIHRFVDQIVGGVKKRQQVDQTSQIVASPLAAVRVVQRTRTLGSILSNIVTIAIVIVVMLLVVNKVDSSILGSFALLSAAIGAGLGFGAQNIVKDVLNGILMVAEDQIGVGDVIDTGYATGVVEKMDVRVVQIRDVEGGLWFVRNGEIQRIGNMSQGWARIVLDLAIPYNSDVDLVKSTVLDAAKRFAHSKEWRKEVIEEPEVWGIESITHEALILRLVMKVRPSAKYDAPRPLRLAIKEALDSIDVTLPPVNSVVLKTLQASGDAPKNMGAKGPTVVQDATKKEKPQTIQARSVEMTRADADRVREASEKGRKRHMVDPTPTPRPMRDDQTHALEAEVERTREEEGDDALPDDPASSTRTSPTRTRGRGHHGSGAGLPDNDSEADDS